MTFLLAGLGLGSATLGRWLLAHRGLFLAAALALLALSLVSAVRERRRRDRSTGMVATGIAVLVTAALIAYAWIKDGHLL